MTLSHTGALQTQKLIFLVYEPRADTYSSFKAWNRSEYSHACFTHCQEFLPCPNFDLGSQFTFILFQIRSLPFNCVIANEVSRVGQENKTGHLAHSHKRFKQVLVVSAYGINRYHSLPQDLNPVIF